MCVWVCDSEGSCSIEVHDPRCIEYMDSFAWIYLDGSGVLCRACAAGVLISDGDNRGSAGALLPPHSEASVLYKLAASKLML